MTEIERVARAIYEADDPWHTAFPWPNLNDKQGGAEGYRRAARAAIAAVQADRPVAVTPDMADAMLRFLQTPQAKLLTNTEGFRQGIEAALAAAPAHPADTYAAGWRDIETAPKDGTEILGAIRVHDRKDNWWVERHVIAFDADRDCLGSDYEHGWEWSDYEHWTPLPALPLPDRGEAK